MRHRLDPYDIEDKLCNAIEIMLMVCVLIFVSCLIVLPIALIMTLFGG